MFQRIFFKKSQFIVISDEKRQFSKLHFSQKVCETEYSDTALKNFDSVHICEVPASQSRNYEYD